MRHRKAGKKLGRNPSHRRALYRNLAMAIFQNERIVTTVAKAKAVRPFVEKLITLAKQGTLHARRLAISRLGTPGQAEVNPEGDTDADRRTVIQKLFSEIGPRFADRPGGYTRIIKRTYRRLGDAGETCYFELLKEGEQKVRARAAAPAPAPAVEDETPQQEQPAEQQPAAEQGGEQQQPAAEAQASGTAEGGEQKPQGEGQPS